MPTFGSYYRQSFNLFIENVISVKQTKLPGKLPLDDMNITTVEKNCDEDFDIVMDKKLHGAYLYYNYREIPAVQLWFLYVPALLCCFHCTGTGLKQPTWAGVDRTRTTTMTLWYCKNYMIDRLLRK
jgi:hypothetical protein